MLRNSRVGIIKYHAIDPITKVPHVLVDVHEYCSNSSGEVYYATYNLYLEVGSNYDGIITAAQVGSWIKFGFYVQSFREGGTYKTTLKMRGAHILQSTSVVRIEVGDEIKLVPSTAYIMMMSIHNKK